MLVPTRGREASPSHHGDGVTLSVYSKKKHFGWGIELFNPPPPGRKKQWLVYRFRTIAPSPPPTE